MFRRTNNNTSIYNTGSGIAPIEFWQIPGFAVYLTAAYLMPSGPLSAQSTLSEADAKLLENLNIPYSTTKIGKKCLNIEQVDFIERFMKDPKDNEKVISTGDNPEVNNDNAVVNDNQIMLKNMLKKINQEYIDFLVKTDFDEVIFESYNNISGNESKSNNPISVPYPRISDILFGKKSEREQYGLWLYAWSIPRTISFLISVVPVSFFRMLEMGIEYLGDKLIKKQITLMGDSSQNSANALYVPLAILYVALFAVKLASFLVRSVLSYDEIWKKARQMDAYFGLSNKIGLNENVKITMGPIEIAARIFSFFAILVACVKFPPLLFKFLPVALPAFLHTAVTGVTSAQSFVGSVIPVPKFVSLSIVLLPAVSILALLYVPVKWGMKKVFSKKVHQEDKVKESDVTSTEVSQLDPTSTDSQTIPEESDGLSDRNVISTKVSQPKLKNTVLDTILKENEDDERSVDTIEYDGDSFGFRDSILSSNGLFSDKDCKPNEDYEYYEDYEDYVYG